MRELGGYWGGGGEQSDCGETEEQWGDDGQEVSSEEAGIQPAVYRNSIGFFIRRVLRVPADKRDRGDVY